MFQIINFQLKITHDKNHLTKDFNNQGLKKGIIVVDFSNQINNLKVFY